VKQGVVSPQDAYDYCNDKQMFAQFAPRDASGGATMAGTSSGGQVSVPGMVSAPRPAPVPPIKKTG
jgi:hypothetical protein